MCSAPKNSYLSRRTYSDTSAELVEARVGLTSFDTFKTGATTPEQPVNVSELLKRPARYTKATSNTDLNTSEARCYRSLSEFWTIQIFSLHCDQINRDQHRESRRVP